MKHRFSYSVFVSILGAVGAYGAPARATTELPLRFNARSLAMGGTGVAFVDDASAIAINPARLDRIENWSATLGVTPFFPRSTAPFTPRPGEPVRRHSTETQAIPLFFAGGALRVLDPLTTGLAVYVATGFGGRYEDLPEYGGLDMRLDLAVFEVALPVGYRITDELAVGVALRFGHAFIEADMPIDIGVQDPLRLEFNVSGQAFPGVLAGVAYSPIPELGFGFTYRSKLTFDLEGDGTATAVFGRQPADISAELSTPHSFRIGTAWAVVPERLLLALDVSYTLFDDANDVLPLGIQFKQIDFRQDQQIPFYWDDSIAALVGAEYMVTEMVAARGGYHVAKMATPDRYADPLFPPPGIVHTIHLGGGLRWTNLRLDLGGAYAFGGGEVNNSVNTPPGTYDGGYVLVGASATYTR
jgi:long-subunit fatty acid transport protein